MRESPRYRVGCERKCPLRRQPNHRRARWFSDEERAFDFAYALLHRGHHVVMIERRFDDSVYLGGEQYRVDLDSGERTLIPRPPRAPVSGELAAIFARIARKGR
jgi:hypothetical protein